MNNWSVLEAPKAPRNFFLPLSTRYNEIFENRVCPPPNIFSWGGHAPPKFPYWGGKPPQSRILKSVPAPALLRFFSTPIIAPYDGVIRKFREDMPRICREGVPLDL